MDAGRKAEPRNPHTLVLQYIYTFASEPILVYLTKLKLQQGIYPIPSYLSIAPI